MNTLTDAAQVTRKSVIVLGIMLVGLIVGRMLWTLGVSLYDQFRTPPYPQASANFGRLPRIDFGDSQQPQLTYRLETPDQGVPSFGPIAPVYFSATTRSNLLNLERAKKYAAALGFVFEPAEVSEKVFRWRRTSPIPATLEMDINTSNFVMNVAWETDPGFLVNLTMPSENQAVAEAKNYLKRAGFLYGDIDEGVTEVELLRYEGGELRGAVSLSEAEFVKVNLFRENIVSVPGLTEDSIVGDFLPIQIGSGRILSTDPKRGVAEMLISGSNSRGDRVVQSRLTYTEIVYDQFETYPLITGDQAWQKLINGEGFVAQAPQGNEAVVRRVDLGFYDPLKENSYIQPIYIFFGDGFVGYVPAIRDEYFQAQNN